MNILDFKEQYKQAKSHNYEESYSVSKKVKVLKHRGSNPLWHIKREETKIINSAKITVVETIDIMFKKQIPSMTIFEVGMLWNLFAKGKKVVDYANYADCQSGKTFIENIEHISTPYIKSKVRT